MAKSQVRSDGTCDLLQYPIVDLFSYLKDPKMAFTECQMVANLLNKFGFICVKDPRVNSKHNDEFLDMMEKYYEQSDETKAKDIRKEAFYQVGLTPARKELARNRCELVAKLNRTEKPLTLCPPDLDNKLRFFWRMDNPPPHTSFPQLYADPVIPEGFPEWKAVMNNWGTLTLATAKTVAEMCAIGFDLPADTFTSLMEYGPHLLAPTGSDFSCFGKLETVLASFHTDINFLTIHGRARFSGLFVWTREAQRLTVHVPHGCLLLQAGQQFERLTGGRVLAGFHEVVVSEQTVEEIEEAFQNSRSMWRVSSTLFSHIASDEILQPLECFATPEAMEKYPPVTAGAHLLAELAAVNLNNTLSSHGDTVLVAM